MAARQAFPSLYWKYFCPVGKNRGAYGGEGVYGAQWCPTRGTSSLAYGMAKYCSLIANII